MATNDVEVPVWTLATQPTSNAVVANEGSLTSARLTELRTVLASLADSPVVTLEAHDVPKGVDRAGGMSLGSASPLASQLAQLVKSTPKVTSEFGGETLYRMTVPAKVASQMGSGLVKPMVSKAGGVHSALLGRSGIVAHASYVPVAGGAVGGSAATAGVAVGAAGAMTIAAPLVLMAVAAGMTVHAEKKRAETLEKITGLLEKLHDDELTRERNALNACVDAIDKATAILLDRGKVGMSIGLDSASYAVSTAMTTAEARLGRWRSALSARAGARIELGPLRASFKGIDEEGGEFRVHLEIAALAIALKKRIIILQAVEHAQMDEGNVFQNFTQALRTDQARVAKLENGIRELLSNFSSLELDRSRGVRDVVFRASEVDRLLDAAYRVRALGAGIDTGAELSDVAIEIVQESDGSVVVFPAHAA
ncbi:hypothetical protein HQ325_15195 [Rhodococcus sp. BP-349]|uniref:hypothetical protein n=1 Tax=unclassified Rhodococcus (in: high G+C Gram-positive bacteria) TaxID=192944 RepID=UPI001C9B6ECE|nr:MULTISPECIES: hypothetical protein [unclassified Rhodococcus (in: high G+C Gram-positive bacteria)]MBY6540023.1 hypothetical protein [Rhodococcus sp. BP-363]MBY6543649.1 hypothetical protein [Rhodococcus sp. BP-369]MBY6562879.1 hypothetical protein [Rhodococcus sp. BP-370]MBY6577171.1 hypothetical protein [Rhodococcus sp. BP-364]MBY6586472.1 hypothetical protein [Rhodococcus sp. BP-358]